jgi:hypothetical protein
MPRKAAPTASQLSEQLARLRNAYENEGKRHGHLQVLNATLTAAVTERTAWLENLRTSSSKTVRSTTDREVSDLLASLQVCDKAGSVRNALDLQHDEEQPPISAGAARRGTSTTAPEYLRSLLTEEHLKGARSSTWLDVIRTVREFVQQARKPLSIIESGDALAAEADAELEQLETNFSLWMLPRHMVVPQEMQKAISVRLDTSEASSIPSAVTAYAVAQTRLTRKQRQAIVIGYATYLRSQPGDKCQQLLQQLSAAAAEHPFSLRESLTTSFKRLVDELEDLLEKWQQCAMVLATVVWSTLTTRQVTIGAVACYPYWFSGSNCEWHSLHE